MDNSEREEQIRAAKSLKDAISRNNMVDRKLDGLINKMVQGKSAEEKQASLEKRRLAREKRMADKRAKRNKVRGQKSGMNVLSDGFNAMTNAVTGMMGLQTNETEEQEEPQGIQNIDNVVWYDMGKKAGDQNLNATGAPIPINLDPNPMKASESPERLEDVDSVQPDNNRERDQTLEEPSKPPENTSTTQGGRKEYTPGNQTEVMYRNNIQFSNSGARSQGMTEYIPPNQNQIMYKTDLKFVNTPVKQSKIATHSELSNSHPGRQSSNASEKEQTQDPVIKQNGQLPPDPVKMNSNPQQNPFMSNSTNPFEGNTVALETGDGQDGFNPFEDAQEKLAQQNKAQEKLAQQIKAQEKMAQQNKQRAYPKITKYTPQPVKLPEMDQSRFTQYQLPDIKMTASGYPKLSGNVVQAPAMQQQSQRPGLYPKKIDFHV